MHTLVDDQTGIFTATKSSDANLLEKSAAKKGRQREKQAVKGEEQVWMEVKVEKDSCTADSWGRHTTPGVVPYSRMASLIMPPSLQHHADHMEKGLFTSQFGCRLQPTLINVSTY
ncbi:hypothetical protein CEXT_244751 [Caerostris extrusa]|uniref:Uncharacterized protein n=1 Tax=Caerostris extrusa TaxID=172846 RepID=A0AAV4QIZ4_CAEEX|nr:hypothetical protein CEXT_244751 [Caerostris extrusa]